MNTARHLFLILVLAMLAASCGKEVVAPGPQSWDLLKSSGQPALDGAQGASGPVTTTGDDGGMDISDDGDDLSGSERNRKKVTN